MILVILNLFQYLNKSLIKILKLVQNDKVKQILVFNLLCDIITSVQEKHHEVIKSDYDNKLINIRCAAVVLRET